MTGFWPYPFLDIDALGGARVAVNIIGLVLAFVVLGLVVHEAAKRLRRRDQPDNPS